MTNNHGRLEFNPPLRTNAFSYHHHLEYERLSKLKESTVQPKMDRQAELPMIQPGLPLQEVLEDLAAWRLGGWQGCIAQAFDEGPAHETSDLQ